MTQVFFFFFFATVHTSTLKDICKVFELRIYRECSVQEENGLRVAIGDCCFLSLEYLSPYDC